MRVYVRKQGTPSQPWRVYCPDCTRTFAFEANWGEAMRRASRHVRLHQGEERRRALVERIADPATAAQAREQAERYERLMRRTLVERIADPSAAARAREQAERILRIHGVDR